MNVGPRSSNADLGVETKSKGLMGRLGFVWCNDLI